VYALKMRQSFFEREWTTTSLDALRGFSSRSKATTQVPAMLPNADMSL
jgi:hypothetical protein